MLELSLRALDTRDVSKGLCIHCLDEVRVDDGLLVVSGSALINGTSLVLGYGCSNTIPS